MTAVMTREELERGATGAAPAIDDAPLDLMTYFDGETTAYGVFEDRFGKMKRRFVVTIAGAWEGDLFVMREVFEYDDGERDQRIWRVQPNEDGTFQAHCDDCVGPANGRMEGGTISLSYLFRLQVSGHEFRVRFQDRMYRINDKVVVNRAVMRKWGLKLGELSLCFSKP